MQKVGAVCGIFVCSLAASGCNNSSAPQYIPESLKPTANQKIGKVLPFSVCDLSRNTAFQNGLSMIRADIRVDGGHSNDWVATGLAVAKQLGALGTSTDVQVYVYRNDLGELEKATTNGYRWLTRIDYGVTPRHSLNTGDGGKPWLITYATDDSVVTPRDIQIEGDYQKLMEKHNQPAIDDNVVAIIKKKYNIKGDWYIPSMNLAKSTNNPDDYFIDKNKQDEKLNDLGRLLVKGAGNFECSV